MATHRTTELAEAVLEIGATLCRQAQSLTTGPLAPGAQLDLAFQLNQKALRLNALSEEMRTLNRPGSKRKPAPPDQELGTGYRIAS